MSDFAGKAALVVGGSRGVGRAIALEIARRGANVAIAYRARRDAADEVVRAIENLGGRGLAIEADVADAEAAGRAVSGTIEAFGELDLLAHSAGALVEWRAVREQDVADWRAFIQNDLVGAFNVIQPTVQHMHARRSGVIIAISSIAAQMCQARNSQGAAAKAGLEALIRVVAREEGRHGVRANAVSIGLTDTDQAREALEQWGEETSNRIISGIPLGRMATSEEVAKLVAYLASEDGSYITGKVIQIDGGQLISG